MLRNEDLQVRSYRQDMSTVMKSIDEIGCILESNTYESDDFNAFNEKWKNQLEMRYDLNRPDCLATLEVIELTTNKTIKKIISYLIQYEARGYACSTPPNKLNVDKNIIQELAYRKDMTTLLAILKDISDIASVLEDNPFNEKIIDQFNQQWRNQLTMTYQLEKEKCLGTLMVFDTINKIMIKKIESYLIQYEKKEEKKLEFDHQPKPGLTNSNQHVNSNDGFWSGHDIKEICVIKNALIQYILDGHIENQISFNELIRVAKQLNDVKKENLVTSIRDALLIENGKLTKKRTKAIEKIEKSYDNQGIINNGIKGAVGGAALSLFLDSNPTIGAIGFFAATSLVTHGVGAYKRYNENELWDQREKRAKFILDMLDNSSQYKSKMTIA